MATGRGGNPGKAPFVIAHLRREPGAGDEAINRAGAAAGNAGDISGSLISKVRAKEGLTGRRKPGGRGAAKKGRARSSARSTAVGPVPESVHGTSRRDVGRTVQAKHQRVVMRAALTGPESDRGAGPSRRRFVDRNTLPS